MKNRQPIRLNLGQDRTCRVLTPALLDLIARMLNFDPAKRPSASDVCNQPVFNHQVVVSQQLYVKREMPDLEPITSFTDEPNSNAHRAQDSVFIVDRYRLLLLFLN
jgi:serine/threonine protein kinase